MSAAAAQLLDAIVPIVRTRLPRGVDVDYLDDFLDRNRAALELVIEQNLGPLLSRMQAANRLFAPDEDIPELWTASKRTAANLAAMATAAKLYAERRLPNAEERAVLAGYSGWGGLSIQAASGKFPAGFPVPEERGLIHEFYTPTKVAREVARVVAPLVHALPHDGETVHALEPSAGIGRFLRAFEAVPGLTWHAVEWSTLSALMLKALRPDLDLTNAPFERWVREKGSGAAGRLGLVVSNPPYGIRGASVGEDPDRAYREKMAYHYFLRRGLDLLAPDGLGVFLVPGGFLTSRTAQFVALREKVLKRHHLAAAYRLPSINEKRREAIFPGAMLVTDLLFFRARGGELDAVDASDQEIVAGATSASTPGTSSAAKWARTTARTTRPPSRGGATRCRASSRACPTSWSAPCAATARWWRSPSSGSSPPPARRAGSASPASPRPTSPTSRASSPPRSYSGCAWTSTSRWSPPRTRRSRRCCGRSSTPR